MNYAVSAIMKLEYKAVSNWIKSNEEYHATSDVEVEHKAYLKGVRDAFHKAWDSLSAARKYEETVFDDTMDEMFDKYLEEAENE